ncbi:MAG: VanZ family protein [Thermodesulfobacteriota bacterium]|nr:VanZ family protein [Thermodesulfobacteriota bacterium]
MPRSLFRAIPMLAVMGIIFFLSHQPHLSFDLEVSHQDKIFHAIAYGVLAASTLFAVLPPGRRVFRSRSRLMLTGLGVVLFCLFYGISDEFHQSFIPGRESSLLDVAADTAGAVIVVSLWLFFRVKDDSIGVFQE